jgi:hypothetical protein
VPNRPASGSPPIEEAPRGGRLRALTWSRRLPTSRKTTWTCFREHLWIGGAGIGPRPVVEEAGDGHGIGCTRRIGVGGRGVRERIVAGEYPRRLEYRVVNPSWTTYPVDHHRGTVAFGALEDGGTEVRWRVEFVPKRCAGPLVTAATRYVIGRYLDALERACGAAAGRTTRPRGRRVA